MKNFNHISKVLLLITIYCFGICASALTIPPNYVDSFQSDNTQNEFLVNSSKAHFLHIQQAENVLAPTAEIILLDYKLSIKDFYIASITYQLQILATFKQYKNHLKTLRIRYRKADLIFPFHNFW